MSARGVGKLAAWVTNIGLSDRWLPIAVARMHAPKMLEQVERFVEPLHANARILDAGCGPGRDLERFVANGHRPIGIDLTSEFVAMALEFAPMIEGDLREPQTFFEESSFDAIWASASLVHLDDAETLAVLQSFHMLLRTGGQLYACVMSTGQTGWLEESAGLRWYRAWPDQEFAEVVEHAGFVLNDVIKGPYVEVGATRAD